MTTLRLELEPLPFSLCEPSPDEGSVGVVAEGSLDESVTVGDEPGVTVGSAIVTVFPFVAVFPPLPLLLLELPGGGLPLPVFGSDGEVGDGFEAGGVAVVVGGGAGS